MASKVWDDRIEPRKKEHGKYPFDFKAPSYDNRTSSSMAAGNDYGVGFNQPVGTFKASSLADGPIPRGVHTRNGHEYIKNKDMQG